MLVVLLYVKDDCSRYPNLREEVLIPQNEEDLARLLVVLSHHVMINDSQVIHHPRHLWLSCHRSLKLSISEREDIPVDLDDI